MDTKQAIQIASEHLCALKGHVFDLLSVSEPISANAALNLPKVVSKLSPLLGNLIEFNTVEFLNLQQEFKPFGKWIRQDPGFPDVLFQGNVTPAPGLEIKAWFPLGTEITARFRDSQNHFAYDQTYVALLAWLPERLIFGKPYILDVCIVSALSVAAARDAHYHNPPDYLVIEPEDTSARARNLQQTNTNGYKWQGTQEQLPQARQIVHGWGRKGQKYRPTRDYQAQLRQLLARFPYRLDTNFAKMDRIVHTEIEGFKARVLASQVHGKTVRDWARIFIRNSDESIKAELRRGLGIRNRDAGQLVR